MSKACRQLRCSALLAALLAVAVSGAWGQSITSTPNVVGSGARALGMGGAFIAVADDATAASWNPGGLTQLERPEISLVYNGSSFSERFSAPWHGGLEGRHSVDFNRLNYLSVVYPIPWTLAGRNFVVSLNYQSKLDYDRDLKVRYRRVGGDPFFGSITHRLQYIDYEQRGSLSSLSPAFGFEVTDRLSLGLVWNIWDDKIVPGDNGWRESIETYSRINVNDIGSGRITPLGRKVWVERRYEDFEGHNFTVGALYRATERLTLGAVYHTKFTAKTTRTEVQRMFRGGPNSTVYTERDLTYTFPSAIGVGAAYRFPNDKLTLSLDITRREWDQYVVQESRPDGSTLRFSKLRRSAVTQRPKHLSPHDPTYTVRFGAEYVFVNAKKPEQKLLPSLRAGLMYDPEPASGRDMKWYGMEAKGDGKVEDYYGLTLGAGVLIRDRVNIDAAYVFRWGNDVRSDTWGQYRIDATADVRQHYFYLSTVIYF